ncbi:MAG: transcription elongation factor GreA [Treponema sp.]|uniref:transcription elongation factor GreA n=1 Tax=Treponema sp. TaxID=166 RepID=UPI00298EA689|nr:transcription elongation factor GreA [Treponema sp.]MDD5812599.1 transcription elongation factor GreA [Treponema sp.]
MSKELESKVQEMLKEETWTRATISNYTKNNLTELTTLIEKAREENCVAEIKAICDEHLTHSKDSIIALYISGILSVRDGALDNSSLVTLVDIFQKAHKEPIVVYLCETVLEEDENNKFALRTLAKAYREENNEKVWELYEKIVKLDFEEAELAKALAEHYEQIGSDNATDYYKKALLRYIALKNIGPVKELWTKLVATIPEEIDFFLLVQRKVAKSISEDKSALLMQELYNWYKDNSHWDIAIDILKLILSIDPKDPWARREIVECYRGKYKDHSHLEDYIRSSDLTQSFRNVFEAINDFEKHIAFDAKNFVFHRSWGVGIIRRVESDNLTINFGKKNGVHEMSLKMAISALTPLAKDHIWVLKATKSKEELSTFVKENIVDTLKIIIKSFGNKCNFKRIKAELVPAILSTGEWTSWNSKAKKVLESDATFGVNPNDINEYIVRDHEISKEEKFANEFKAQKQFFNRIDIIMKFVNNDETDKESELFADMYNYFIGFIKTITKVTDQVLASYLVVQYIGKVLPQHSYTCKYTFAQIYDDIDDPRVMYDALKDTKNTSLKEDFLANIRLLPNWADEYIRLFPTVLQEKMLTTLLEKGHEDKLKALAKKAFDDVKDYREAILYFFEKCQDKDWFKNCGVTYEKQLITLLAVIDLTYREINYSVNTTENKKINKAATQLLFKNDTLATYMFANNEETVTKMYTLVDDIPDMEPNLKAGLRSKILDKYPDFKFHTTEESKATAPKGMLVTAAKLEEKKALEEDIQKNQLPAVAIEVQEAREKGDLKENAEYHAAREKQQFLNKKLQKLQEELNRAVIFDPTTATSSIISFSTTVTLFNKKTEKEEVYSIFGPWESDSDNNVISYMSPFGNALLDHKAGEEFDFTVNDTEYSYKVVKIEVAR